MGFMTPPPVRRLPLSGGPEPAVVNGNGNGAAASFTSVPRRTATSTSAFRIRTIVSSTKPAAYAFVG